MRLGSAGRARRLVSFALAALALGRPALPAGDVDPALWSRLQRIETAFRDGDADALRPSLSSAAKIRVDLKDLAEGPCAYGAGQLQVIFAQLFQKQRTREFAFRRQDVVTSGPDTAFARGRWVRRNGTQETVDTLNFTLRQEGGDWRVQQILSSR